MTQATREKKIAFIKSFGMDQVSKLIFNVLDEEGFSFFTDAQIDALTHDQVHTARRHNHHKIRNRAILRKTEGLA